MATVTGTSGNDIIIPGLISPGVVGVGEGNRLPGADSINGGDGDDLINGGAGNDTLVGGLGLDVLQGGAGDDTGIFGPGDLADGEVFDGGDGFDTANVVATTTLGALRLIGVERLLVIGNGTTTLLTAAQLAVLEEVGVGVGFNNYRLGAAAAGVFDLTALTFLGSFEGFTGSAGDDRIIGSARAETQLGGAGDDTVEGGAGNDTLAGGAGLDTLLGGVGDDSVRLAADDLAAGEVFDGGAGFDTVNIIDTGTLGALTLVDVERLLVIGNGTTTFLTADQLAVVEEVGAGVGFSNYRLGAAAAGVFDLTDLTFLGTFLGFTGSAGDDRIIGSALAETHLGGGGNDTVEGGAGNDTLAGGAGLDTLLGGVGDDSVALTAEDVAAGEVVDGGAGFDTVNATAIRNLGDLALVDVERLLVAGSGETTFLTAAQLAVVEEVNAGVGFSNYRLGAAAAGVFDLTDLTFLGTFLGFTGSAGDDRIIGSAAGETHLGGAGNDTVEGGAGNDTLAGGAGLDTLLGGAGNDSVALTAEDVAAGEVFDGGAGFDTVNATAIRNLGDLALVDVERLLVAGNGETTFLNPAQLAAFSEVGVGAGGGFTNYRLAASAPGLYDLDRITFFGTLQSFTGSAANDVIGGGALNDTIFGGRGRDTLGGGAGNDLIDGQNDRDTIVFLGARSEYAVTRNATGFIVTDLRPGSPTGTDTVIGGRDKLRFGELGTQGNDLITGGAFDDLLEGVFGNDTLTGEAGDDSLLGGDGDDLLNGGAQGDTLEGGAGTDTLAGGNGDDSLIGGEGADLLEGGNGNDTYLIDAFDTLVERGGFDRIIVGFDFVLPDGFEALTLLETALTGTGNALDNALVGNERANALFGLDGDDSLAGRSGIDLLQGGEGNDTLDGGGGRDALFGGNGNDFYVVNTVDDLIEDSAGTDTVQTSIDYVLPDAIEDLILTDAADASGSGNAAANLLTGSAGANLLSGLAGEDTLNGGEGADTLVGGQGGDRLAGGNGADVIRYAAAEEGGDTILGYLAAEDAVEVSAAGFGAGLSAGIDLVATGRYVENEDGLATAAFAQFIFETDVLRLFFDPDGTGAAAAVVIAILPDALGWTGAELTVIA